ncbi:MAG: hypothetical protein ABI611_12850 [Solirubrobacteraceae bacterium]
MTREGDLPRPAVLTWVDAADAERLRTALRGTDLHVVELNGALVDDAPSLFAAFESLLGRSFAAGRWDALRDVMPEIVGRTRSEDSCLVWDHADNMLHGGLPDLVTALHLLVETSRDLEQHNRRFVTFLIGEGPNFPRLGS